MSGIWTNSGSWIHGILPPVSNDQAVQHTQEPAIDCSEVRSAEAELNDRLLAVLQGEKDAFGEAMAQLRYSFPLYTPFEVDKLQSLLPKCLRIWHLLKDKKEEIILNVGQLSVDHHLLAPLKTLIDELAMACASAATSALQKELNKIKGEYEAALLAFINKKSFEEIQAILEPKAEVRGDTIGFYLIEMKLARKLLSIDEFGNTRRANIHGRHPVASIGGLHIKSNLTTASVSSEYISPGFEYASYTFASCFSPDPACFTVAPTAFMKISGVEVYQCEGKSAKEFIQQEMTQGKSAEEILPDNPGLKKVLPLSYETRTVQIGYTVGYHPGEERITGLSLGELFNVLCLFQRLCDELESSVLSEAWEEWTAIANRKCLRLGEVELLASYLAFMRLFPFEERLEEFKSSGPFQDVDAIARFYADYILPLGCSDLQRLLTIFQLSPELMKNQSLTTLGCFPAVLRRIGQLFPRKSFTELQRLIPSFLEKIDHEAFSVLCLASFCKKPSDGNKENYFVELIWGEEDIQTIKIVSIDSDKVFEPAVKQQLLEDDLGHVALAYPPDALHEQRGEYYLNLHCILFALSSLMKKPVHPRVREHLLAVSPLEFILKWVLQLDERNDVYERLIAEGTLTKRELLEDKGSVITPANNEVARESSLYHSVISWMGLAEKGQALPSLADMSVQAAYVTKLALPLCLPSDLLASLLTVFSKLQALLASPEITHENIFIELEPEAWSCYHGMAKIAESPWEMDEILRKKPRVKEYLGPVDLQYSSPLGEMVSFKEEVGHFLSSLYLSPTRSAHYALLNSTASLSFAPQLSLSLEQAQSFYFEAVKQGNLVFAQLMIANGAKGDALNKEKQNALHLLMRVGISACESDAALFGFADFILTKFTLDPNQEDGFGLTPLLYLLEKSAEYPTRFSGLLEKLVCHGASVEKADRRPDYRGEYPLEKAIREDDVFLFVELVRRGAGAKERPALVLKFIESHQEDQRVQEAFGLLEAKSARISYLWTLKSMTIKPEEGVLQHCVWKGAGNKAITFHPEVLEQLLIDPSTGLFAQMNDGKTFAPRQVSYQGKELVFQPYPAMPGNDYAAASLYRHLLGEGALEAELYKYEDANQTAHPVLVFQPVKGERLEEFFDDPQADADLDLHCLHNQMLFSLIVNPSERDAADFVVQSFVNHEGLRKKRLLSVRSEVLFLPSFTLGQEPVEMRKNILYCLGEMAVPLHPKTREYFLSLDPENILLEWLDDLHHQQQSYMSLFGYEERRAFYSQSQNHPMLLSILIPSEIIYALDNQMSRIRKVLKTLPHATPFDILSQLEPEQAIRYKQAVQCIDLSPLERLSYLNEGDWLAAGDSEFQIPEKERDALEWGNIPEETQLDKMEEENSPSKAQKVIGQIIRQRELSYIRYVAGELKKGNAAPFHEILVEDIREEVVASLHAGKGKGGEDLLQAMEAISAYPYQSLCLAGYVKLPEQLVESILRKSPRLLKLDLTMCKNLSPAFFEKVGTLCPYLTHLRLDALSQIKKLTLGFLPQLVHLSLVGCFNLEELSFTAPQLHSLNVDQCNSLASLQMDAKSLKQLNAGSFPSLPLIDFVGVVRKCPKLEELFIHRNDFEDLPYGTLVKQIPLLMKYDLTLVDSSFLDILQENVGVYLSQTSLELKGVPLFGEKEGEVLSLVLKNYHHICLSFDYAEQSMETVVAALAHVLRENPHVESLELCDSMLGDLEIKKLADVLSHSPCLYAVNFARNLIANQGAELIADKLLSAPALRSVNLNHNAIGDSGASAFAKVLHKNTPFYSLELASNSIGPAGGQALAKAIKHHQTIVTLALEGNEIAETDEIWQSLKDSLERNIYTPMKGHEALLSRRRRLADMRAKLDAFTATGKDLISQLTIKKINRLRRQLIKLQKSVPGDVAQGKEIHKQLKKLKKEINNEHSSLEQARAIETSYVMTALQIASKDPAKLNAGFVDKILRFAFPSQALMERHAASSGRYQIKCLNRHTDDAAIIESYKNTTLFKS